MFAHVNPQSKRKKIKAIRFRQLAKSIDKNEFNKKNFKNAKARTKLSNLLKDDIVIDNESGLIYPLDNLTDTVHRLNVYTIHPKTKFTTKVGETVMISSTKVFIYRGKMYDVLECKGLKGEISYMVVIG